MKKIALLAALLFVFSSGAAFAWTSGTYDAGDTAGTVTVGTSGKSADVKVSKGVSLAYKSQATGLGYSVATYHSSGTKTFASSSGDSKIWSQNTTAVAPPDAPSGTASANFTSSWTAL